jgi:hypothetical protein
LSLPSKRELRAAGRGGPIREGRASGNPERDGRGDLDRSWLALQGSRRAEEKWLAVFRILGNDNSVMSKIESLTPAGPRGLGPRRAEALERGAIRSVARVAPAFHPRTGAIASGAQRNRGQALENTRLREMAHFVSQRFQGLGAGRETAHFAMPNGGRRQSLQSFVSRGRIRPFSARRAAPTEVARKSTQAPEIIGARNFVRGPDQAKLRAAEKRRPAAPEGRSTLS